MLSRTGEQTFDIPKSKNQESVKFVIVPKPTGGSENRLTYRESRGVSSSHGRGGGLFGSDSFHVCHACGRRDTNPLLREEFYQKRTRTAVALGRKYSLALLISLYAFEVDVEQVRRVLGTSARLGVELCREDGTGNVDKP